MNNPHMELNELMVMRADGSNGRSMILHGDGHLYIVDTASCHRGDFTNMINVTPSDREHFSACVSKGVDYVISCVDMVNV